MTPQPRKFVVHFEEVWTEGGHGDGEPLRKAIAACVIANPYASRFSEDLSELVDPSAAIGRELGARAAAALGASVESYGKASLVGIAGEQEHGVACQTSVFGDALRDAVGGATAWLPSVSKRCAPGATVDVPLAFKEDIWVRSHYDTVTFAIEDAPGPDEIVVICAVASRGRLNARLGGKTREEALAAR
jgi:amino acid synthesis protein